MEKNDSWDLDSEYLDTKKFPPIKLIDASLVPEINLSPPDKNSYYKYWQDFPNITNSGFIDNGLIDNKPLEPEILVIPDVHGRDFWKSSIVHWSQYEKIIFLGDYLDPYKDEGIDVLTAIENFKWIINHKKTLKDKVVLLLGNHDLPYYSQKYYDDCKPWCGFSRYSYDYAKEIKEIFAENKDLFTLVHIQDDIIFSHAGFRQWWVDFVNSYSGETNIYIDTDDINNFLETNKLLTSDRIGLLSICSYERGGLYRHKNGSCVWADAHEYLYDDPLDKYKQIFGHTLQYYIQEHNGQIEYLFDNPIVEKHYMCLDNGHAHIVDAKNFKLIDL